MRASSEHARRKADPGNASRVSPSAWPGIEGAMIPNTVINDDFAHIRAEELDAEAEYYGRRAVQEEQALGSGYYVDLLQSMAADRAAMAQRLRMRNSAT